MRSFEEAYRNLRAGEGFSHQELLWVSGETGGLKQKPAGDTAITLKQSVHQYRHAKSLEQKCQQWGEIRLLARTVVTGKNNRTN